MFQNGGHLLIGFEALQIAQIAPRQRPRAVDIGGLPQLRDGLVVILDGLPVLA
jgi:hypothetical protein